MVKIHQRTKKKYDLSRTKQHKAFFKGIWSPNRPKTYKSEESAINAAEKRGLKKDSYTLVAAKKNKKFMIKLAESK
jgi:hypothetical protein